MALRLTTAMTLIAAAGLVAACNEETETTVADAGTETVIVEESGNTETAAADGAVSADVVVPNEPRVVGATGGELEAAMGSSGSAPTVGDGAASEGEATELTSAQPSENLPQSSEAEMPAEVAADAGDAVAENEQAIEAAAQEVVPAAEADAQAAETADAGQTATDGATPATTGEAATTELAADAGTTPDAAVVDGSASTETASITGDAGDAGIEPLTDEELASLNLDDLEMQGGVERLTAYVEGSDAFDATEKTTLVAGLEAAQDDPEQMQVLFDQIKEVALNAN